jgi:SAM-dependent methyltransferase
LDKKLATGASLTNTVFKDYARYYDLLYRDKDYTAETDYVIDLLKKFGQGQANSQILELGCGTGNYSIALAKRGYDILGLDISEDMIQYGSERLASNEPGLAKKIELRTGDIRNFDLHQKFKNIVSLFHVISYLSADRDLLYAFQSVARHLKPGGLFVFDFWYGPGVENLKPEKRTKKVSDSELIINRTAEPVFRKSKHIVDVNYRIEVRDISTNSRHNIEESHRMRYFFDDELRIFLKQAGLQIEGLYSWLGGEEPDDQSWSACCVASKLHLK